MKIKMLHFFLAFVALAAVILFTGCSGYPVAIAVQGEHGTYGYSSKSGLTITIEK